MGSFHGLWTDPVTGLSYARARWYDARTASFLSEDPLGDVDSPNLYAYVAQNPFNFRDPLGQTIKTGEKELEEVRSILKGIGREDLSEYLSLQDGALNLTVEGLYAWAYKALKDPLVAVLLDAISDPTIELNLNFVSSRRLIKWSGGTTSEPLVVKKNGYDTWVIKTKLDPEIVNNVRLHLGYGEWIDERIDVAVIHEIAHAVKTKQRHLRSTFKFGGSGPTDDFAIEIEDMYRARLGLPLRHSHETLSAYCPNGDWESSECRKKIFCIEADVYTGSRSCSEKWEEHERQ